MIHRAVSCCRRTIWPDAAPGLPGRTRLAPTLLVGFAADAAGQALGYLAGAGDAPARLLRFEFARTSHVSAADRSLLDSAP